MSLLYLIRCEGCEKAVEDGGRVGRRKGCPEVELLANLGVDGKSRARELLHLFVPVADALTSRAIRIETDATLSCPPILNGWASNQLALEALLSPSGPDHITVFGWLRFADHGWSVLS